MAGTDYVLTVDEVIKQRAASKLKKEIETLTRPVREFLEQHPNHTYELPRYKDSSGARTTIRGALDEIESTLYQVLLKRREIDAVHEFIGKHEAIQAALDELKIEASPANDTHIHVHAKPRERLKGE